MAFRFFSLLLTIVALKVSPVSAQEKPTTTEGDAATAPAAVSPATPTTAETSEPTTGLAPVELFSLDYNEDLDLFYAPGTQKLYTGPVFSVYESGKKELRGALKDGKRDGHWVEFYENGKIASVGDYRDGKEVGYWRYWFENGTLQSEGAYSDATPVGKWFTYYESGKKESEGVYVAGEMDGPWKIYDDTNGEVRTVNFKDGEQLP